MKHPTDILIKPLLVEKVMRGNTDSRKSYAFWVAIEANKKEIKKAVEDQFKVKVKAVHTVMVRSKPKRTRMMPGQTPEHKKAIVTLQPGKRIDILENL